MAHQVRQIEKLLGKIGQKLKYDFVSHQQLILPKEIRSYHHKVLLVRAMDGSRFILRLPTEYFRKEAKQAIEQEFFRLGLLKYNAYISLRSPFDQKELHDYCIIRGLYLPRMLYADDDGSLTGYIEGENLSMLLRRNHSQVNLLRSFLDQLHRIHLLGIRLGDRVPWNVIVDEKGLLWQIDFDVELQCCWSAEFEISQAIFYSLDASSRKQEQVDSVLSWLKKRRDSYKLEIIGTLLQNFVNYKSQYRNRRYQDVCRALAPLVSRIVKSG